MAGRRHLLCAVFALPALHRATQVDFDVREDEEQDDKLSETLELLLAAGYFRARIKGLSPFDKVCVRPPAPAPAPWRTAAQLGRVA